MEDNCELRQESSTLNQYEGPWIKEYTKCEEDIQLSVIIQKVGQDLSMSVTGGSKPHIGAVALATYGPLSHDKEHWSSSVSLLTVSGHKEGNLAMEIAERLAKVFETTILVSCGIHIDNATKKDINKIVSLANKLVDEVMECYQCHQEA